MFMGEGIMIGGVWGREEGRGRLHYKLITRLLKSLLSMLFALNLFRNLKENISVSHCILFFLTWQVTLFQRIETESIWEEPELGQGSSNVYTDARAARIKGNVLQL